MNDELKSKAFQFIIPRPSSPFCVNPDNKAAQAFYHSFGFVDTGRMHSGEQIYSLAV